MRLVRINKSWIPYLAALAASTAALAASIVFYHAAGTKTESMERALSESAALQSELSGLAARMAEIERKGKLTGAKAVNEAMDDVLRPLGLSGKVSRIERLESQAKNEEKAEAQIKGLTMNEAVNMLYRLERAPMLLIVRKAEFKASFSSAETLDATLTISLVKPQ